MYPTKEEMDAITEIAKKYVSSTDINKLTTISEAMNYASRSVNLSDIEQICFLGYFLGDTIAKYDDMPLILNVILQIAIHKSNTTKFASEAIEEFKTNAPKTVN